VLGLHLLNLHERCVPGRPIVLFVVVVVRVASAVDKPQKKGNKISSISTDCVRCSVCIDYAKVVICGTVAMDVNC
jgi:hypothetical protein